MLAAIADPTRRAILGRLARGEARVTDVAEPFDMSLAAVSKHVRILERAGLVRRTRQGREHSDRRRPRNEPHLAISGPQYKMRDAFVQRVA